MTKLWNKGYDVNKEVEKYLAGDSWGDQQMVKHECIASIAHGMMLNKIGILNDNEIKSIKKVLVEIIELDKNNKFIITPQDEDVHTKVENYLTSKLGDVGKKIHTYRSRNDQLLVNPRLYNKEKLLSIEQKLLNLIKSLINLAKSNKNIPMPGYTHRQKAMLSSIGLWIGAYAESFMDDFEVLSKAYELNDQNPLGSAASFGVPKNIDREFTTKLMGFSKTQKNTLYCQNSRGKIESIIVSALSQIMITIGKLSADLILFSTNEFGYIKLGNEVSTGSSIMPQKRNPDVPELMKGNVSIVLGYENIIKNAIKDLPSGYNKESQVVKEHTIKSILLTMDSIDMMQICIDTLTINDEICKKSCTKELFATDLAYDLVDQGIPFREAYNKIASEIDSIEVPDLNEAIKKRCHIGAPGNLGLDKLSKNIELKENELNKKKKFFENSIKKLLE